MIESVERRVEIHTHPEERAGIAASWSSSSSSRANADDHLAAWRRLTQIDDLKRKQERNQHFRSQHFKFLTARVWVYGAGLSVNVWLGTCGNLCERQLTVEMVCEPFAHLNGTDLEMDYETMIYNTDLLQSSVYSWSKHAASL